MAEVLRIEIPIEVDDRMEPELSRASQRLSGFERQVRNAQSRFERMTRRPWRLTISAFERVSPTLERITGQLRSLTGRAWRISIGVATAPLRTLNYIWSRLTSIQGLVTAWLGGQAFRAGVLGPLGLADRMQRALIGFETFLGSRRRAMDFLAQLQRFAAETPFEMLELLEFGTQLLPVFKGRTDMVMRTLKAFGDAAAMTGAGIEGMSLALLGFRQIATMGKLSMEELRQVTENLLIPLEPVIEELGIAKDQLKDLGKMNIPAERAMEAILRALERPPERGGFLGGMAKQMSTLANQVSRLRDVLINTFVLPWGTGLAEGVANALGALSDWFERNQATVQRWSAALREAGEALSGWFAARIEGLMRRLDELLGPRPVGRDVEVLSRGRLAAMAAARRRYVESIMGEDEGVLTRGRLFALERGPREPTPQPPRRSLGEWVSLAWDELIVQPFEEWWQGGGQQKVERIAGRIGGALGAGISGFLATALGIAAGEEQMDSPFAQAGASAGRAFTEAFVANFDTDKIVGKLWEAIKGIFGNVADLWPGGERATPSSWASAILAGWLGIRAVRAGRRLIGGGVGAWKGARRLIDMARGRFGRRPPAPPPGGPFRVPRGWEVVLREPGRLDRPPTRWPAGWEQTWRNLQRVPQGQRISIAQRVRDWIWRRIFPHGRGGRRFPAMRGFWGVGFTAAPGRFFPGAMGVALDAAAIIGARPGAERTQVVGSILGRTIGGAIGAGLGSLVPGPGTAIGGIIGSWLGGMAGERVAQPIANFFRRILPGHVREGMAAAQQEATAGVGQVTSALGAMPGQANPILSAFPGLVGTWLGPLSGVMGGTASDAVGAATGAFGGLPGGVSPHLAAVIARINAIGPSWFTAAWRAASQLASGVMSAITSLPGRVGGILSSIASRLRQIGSTLFARARDAFGRLVQGYRAGMDEHSPSYIERSLARVEGAVWSTIDSVGRGTALLGRMARQSEAPLAFATPPRVAGQGGPVAVTVQVPSVSLTVQVTGASGESVVQAIRTQSRQLARALADDIALEIARAIGRQNMAAPAAMA